MKEFDVTITETLEKNVKVEAESRQEAEDAVKKAYYNSEYVLDAENFTGVQFATQAERDIQQEQPTMDVLLVRPGSHFRHRLRSYGGNLPDDKPCPDSVLYLRQQRTEPDRSELSALPVCSWFPRLLNYHLCRHIRCTCPVGSVLG